MKTEYFEFCLVFEPSQLEHIKNLKQNLCDALKFDGKNGVLRLENDRLFVAVKKEYEKQAKDIFKLHITKIVTENYKLKYFSCHIQDLNNLGNLKTIFLKVLTMFDVEQDMLEVEKNLRFENVLVLDAFYRFRLSCLQKKWQQICDMTNENTFFFSTNSLVFELLRFLLSSVKPKQDYLTLSVSHEHLQILNAKNEVIFSQSTQSVDSTIILKILDNYPKRIYVKNSEKLDGDFSNLMYSIFKNTLKPLYFV